MEKRVNWTCLACGAEFSVEYATDKKYLHCNTCGQYHRITGLYIDSTPIFHKIVNKRS